jgi:peptidoglycan/LPS O-acetylase OafA/YrhL
LPALAALAWLCRTSPAYPFLFAAAEVAFVFWFAYATPWRGFNRFGDYSYGLYLWGYPMQQAVAGSTAICRSWPMRHGVLAGAAAGRSFVARGREARAALEGVADPSTHHRWRARWRATDAA